MSTESAGMRFEYDADVGGLSHYNFGSQGPLWWGMWGIIFIEATVFASLVTGYFYLGIGYPEWPPPGVKKPDLLLPTVSSLVLFASSLPMHRADQAVRRGDNRTVKFNLLASIALALVFLALKYVEYSDVEYRWDSHAYGSVVWAIVVFHSAHVTALVLKTTVVSVLAWRGFFNERRRLGLEVNGIYWHFVVAVWLPLYLVLYWSPRLLGG